MAKNILKFDDDSELVIDVKEAAIESTLQGIRAMSIVAPDLVEKARQMDDPCTKEAFKRYDKEQKNK